MRRGRREPARLTLATVAVMFASLIAAPAQARLVTEFALPSALKDPSQIAAGPDGALWFTQRHYGPGDGTREVLGRITTAGADVSTLALSPSTSEVRGITSGPDGALWYASAGPSAGRLGRVTADAISEVELPAGSGAATSIATGPDGALWFTTRSQIGRLVPGEAVRLFQVPQVRLPGHIVSGRDGALWFADLLTRTICRITTAGVVQSFRVPLLLVDSLVAGSDGAVWFTSSLGQHIGRITRVGRVRLYGLSHDRDAPVSIAAGADGALWFTRYFGVGRITTTGELTEIRIPGDRDEGRSPYGIAAGPDGALWFAIQIENYETRSTSGAIGRIDLPASADELLVTRLTNAPSRGRRGGLVRVSFTATRRSSGSLRVGGDDGVLIRRTIRAKAGANSIMLRLPRRAGTYRLSLRLGLGLQSASDNASLIVR